MAVLLPQDFDKLDVVAQLQIWRRLIGSRRFEVTADEAITEIKLARQARAAEFQRH